MKYKKQIYTILSLLIATLFIWYFSTIFFYILIAMVFSLLGAPVVALLDRIKVWKFKLPHTLNAGITLLLMMTILGTFIAIVTPLLAKQVDTLSNLDTTSIEQVFKTPISNLEHFLKAHALMDDSKNLGDIIKIETEKFIDKFKFSDLFSNIASFLSSAFGALFIISFITFFVLRDTKIFYRLLLALIPTEYHEEVENITFSTKRLLTRYFLGLIIDITLVSSLYTIALWILGVQNALLIGILGGLMNVIPYIGPFIGVTIGLFIGIVSGLPMDFSTELTPLTLKILSTFIIVNLLDAMLFQPNIYAKSVNAHPLEIFFVIIIAGTIAGIPGMMLAIPTYSFIRIVARAFFYKYPIVQKFTNSLRID